MNVEPTVFECRLNDPVRCYIRGTGNGFASSLSMARKLRTQ